MDHGHGSAPLHGERIFAPPSDTRRRGRAGSASHVRCSNEWRARARNGELSPGIVAEGKRGGAGGRARRPRLARLRGVRATGPGGELGRRWRSEPHLGLGRRRRGMGLGGPGRRGWIGRIRRFVPGLVQAGGVRGSKGPMPDGGVRHRVPRRRFLRDGSPMPGGNAVPGGVRRAPELRNGCRLLRRDELHRELHRPKELRRDGCPGRTGQMFDRGLPPVVREQGGVQPRHPRMPGRVRRGLHRRANVRRRGLQWRLRPDLRRRIRLRAGHVHGWAVRPPMPRQSIVSRRAMQRRRLRHRMQWCEQLHEHDLRERVCLHRGLLRANELCH